MFFCLTTTQLHSYILGSLISLLRRIYAIHTVIVQAIASANASADIPDSYNLHDIHRDAVSDEYALNDGIYGRFTECDDTEQKDYTMEECHESTNSVRLSPITNIVASGPQIIIPDDQLKALKVWISIENDL